jgi:hypothetical protein
MRVWRIWRRRIRSAVARGFVPVKYQTVITLTHRAAHVTTNIAAGLDLVGREIPTIIMLIVDVLEKIGRQQRNATGRTAHRRRHRKL